MFKPFTITEPRFDHISTPTKLGSLIPDVISSFSNPEPDRNHSDESDLAIPQLTIVTDSNRSKVEKLVGSHKLMVVHCWYKADEDDDDGEEIKISLSSTTYLWDEVLDIRSRLIYADGIAIAPEDQVISFMDTAKFTLYFEPLPTICKTFWLWEQTSIPFAFASFDIERNENDEYWVDLVSAPF